MNKHCGISIPIALASLLLMAPGASAAEEAGWRCTANDSEPNLTVLASGSSGLPFMPSIPPEGRKVITGWKVQVGPGIGPVAQRLEVFEVQNEKGEYKKIGESDTEPLVEGANSFPTRIPVTEGDSVGLYGPVKTVFCDNESGAISIRHQGGVATGEIKAFAAQGGVGTPVVVTVEPDRDGDGYGDETQDRCPAGAAHQGDCPRVRPEIVDVVTTKRAILVKARVASEAAVKVFGFVKWRARQASGSAGTSKNPTASVVGLNAGRPRTLAGGATSTFKLALPEAVKRRLWALSSKAKLRANITVRATDLARRASDRRLTVSLKGASKDA